MVNQNLHPSKDQKPVSIFIISYTALLLPAVVYCLYIEQIWKSVALIIGAIYVYIAAYYFYDNIFLPYKAEIFRAGKESETFDPYNKRNNVPLWMLRWILPALAIQLFIYAGFFFIAGSNVFNGSAFTHPYHYGEIYKRWVNDYSAIPVSSMKILSQQPEDENRAQLPPYAANPLDYVYIFKVNRLKEIFSANCKSVYQPPASLNEFDSNTQNDSGNSKHEVTSYCDDFIDSTIKNNQSNNDHHLKLMLFATIETQVFKIPFIIAFTFSFIGTMMYTIKEIAFRLYTRDLYPNSLVNFLIRFLTAPAVSMVIAYFWMDDWNSFGAPLTFFIVGFFPQIAMQFTQRMAEKYIGSRETAIEKHESLSRLQGMTEYLSYRFKEIGVGDAQNLAYVDLPHLGNNIGYGRRLLVDLVAQALLYVHFRDSFSKLNNQGVRNIITFRSMINQSDDPSLYIKTLASNSGVNVEQIEGVYHLVTKGVLKERVDTLEEIAHADESDQMLQLSGN